MPDPTVPAPPSFEEDDDAVIFDAGRDERVATAAEDKPRAAVARRAPDGGSAQTPAPVSVCLQPFDFPRPAEK